MPATPARIGFITQKFRRVTAGPDPAVEAQFGSAARDTPEPVETFFENEADAQVMASERLTLLGGKRRMVEIIASDDNAAFDLDYAGTLATAQVIDDEKAIDRPMIIVAMDPDLAGQSTTFRTWG